MAKHTIYLYLKKYKLYLLIIVGLSIFLPIINNTIPKLSQLLIDKGIILKDINFILIVSSSIVVLYALKYLFNNIVQAKVINMSLNSVTDIKKDIINSTVNLPIIFHDENSSEYILSRINEVDNLSTLFSADLITFLINLFSALIAIILIFYKNVIIGISSLLLIPIFIFVIKNQFKKINSQIFDSLESSAKTNEKMYSVLKGTITIKQFNEEEKLLNDLNSNIDNLKKILLAKNYTLNKNTNIVSFFTIAIQTILSCVVAIFIVRDSLTVGDYLSISQYISLLYVPVISYQTIGLSIRPALISIKRLKKFNQPPTKLAKKNQINYIDKINVLDLNFSYKKDIPVLKNIGFSLEKGDKLLITGPNGSGKSSLAKLLLGFYNNYSGSILINDKELQTIDEKSLREKIAILPQSCYLFDTTILDNIKIANNSLENEQFMDRINYLKSLNLFKGINLDNNLIENGKNLSGGQIQRISLARVLIRDFDVCIFDEITNSLDSESKDIIKEIIKNEFKDKICIFISHDNYFKDLTNKVLNLNNNNNNIN